MSALHDQFPGQIDTVSSRNRLKRIATTALLAVGLGIGAASCNSSDDPTNALTDGQTSLQLKTVQVATGLDRPWSLAFLPDGRMLVTERVGNLRIVDEAGNVSTPITGVPAVRTNGQGGLLDVQLAPNFASDPTIYLTYSEATGDGRSRTAVARADFSESALNNVQTIFRQQPAVASDVHFGSRLVFDATGNLFVTLGDRGNRDSVQQTDNLFGKVVRIGPDGSIPPDNPFVGSANSDPALFTYGHRNPQGAAMHPVTGEIWIHEHGPQGGDEVNRLDPGKNYGWPRITYGVEYGSALPIGEGTSANDVEPPLHYWVPVSVAPAGMTFYTSNAIPSLTGKLLIGGLAARALICLTLSDGQVTAEQQVLSELNERIRDVRQGPDGYPYLLTDSGKILRVEAQ